MKRIASTNTDNTPCIYGMQTAHLTVGILCRNGSDDRTDQNLGKTAGAGEDNRTDHKPEVYGVGEQKRPDRVDEKSCRREDRGDLDGQRNVEFV